MNSLLQRAYDKDFARLHLIWNEKNMIFIGDIAVPFDLSSYLPRLPDCFSGPVIANLEGGITDTKTNHIQKAKLFNHSSVLDYLNSLNVKVASLANNHIFDVHQSPSNTIKRLHNKGIAVCGAGDSIGVGHERNARPKR